jgi:hypothetical protein
MRLSATGLPSALCALLVLAGCTPTPDVSASTSPSASVAASPSATPMPTYPVASCPDLTDNTALPTPTFAAGTTVYYMFGCNDERILVQAVIGESKAGIVFAPQQSEYTFGILSASDNAFYVSKSYTSGTVDVVPMTFYGTLSDLRSPTLVRVVGPTTDMADFKEQDCADYAKVYNVQNCEELNEPSRRFLTEGAQAQWINLWVQ